MNTVTLYSIVGIFLFAIALYSLIVFDHLLRKILALNIMSSGIFLMLVAVAHRPPNNPSDPVPHAMVLTGIVVAVSATALALTLACRIHELDENTQHTQSKTE